MSDLDFINSILDMTASEEDIIKYLEKCDDRTLMLFGLINHYYISFNKLVKIEIRKRKIKKLNK